MKSSWTILRSTLMRKWCRSETTNRPGVYFHALLSDGVREVRFELVTMS